MKNRNNKFWKCKNKINKDTNLNTKLLFYSYKKSIVSNIQFSSSVRNVPFLHFRKNICSFCLHFRQLVVQVELKKSSFFTYLYRDDNLEVGNINVYCWVGGRLNKQLIVIWMAMQFYFFSNLCGQWVCVHNLDRTLGNDWGPPAILEHEAPKLNRSWTPDMHGG